MDGLHDGVGIQAVHGGDALHSRTLHHLGGGIEDAEAFQLHWHTLCNQFGQVVDDFLQHALDDVALEGRAMRDHVVAEATEGEGGLTVDYGVVFAVAGVTFVLVLSEVNPHCNLFFCHNDKMIKVSDLVYFSHFCRSLL